MARKKTETYHLKKSGNYWRFSQTGNSSFKKQYTTKEKGITAAKKYCEKLEKDVALKVYRTDGTVQDTFKFDAPAPDKFIGWVKRGGGKKGRPARTPKDKTPKFEEVKIFSSDRFKKGQYVKFGKGTYPKSNIGGEGRIVGKFFDHGSERVYWKIKRVRYPKLSDAYRRASQISRK